MGKTVGFLIIAGSLAVAGIGGAIMLGAFAQDTNAEAARLTAAPMQQGGGIVNDGPAFATNAMHLAIETPTGTTLVDSRVLRSMLGPVVESGEALCISGSGCLIVGPAIVHVHTPDGSWFTLAVPAAVSSPVDVEAPTLPLPLQ